LTPEQLRKREKFLRNRQQKIEEDKMKKEALLEKKRRLVSRISQAYFSKIQIVPQTTRNIFKMVETHFFYQNNDFLLIKQNVE
jgi:hypothetical protein